LKAFKAAASWYATVVEQQQRQPQQPPLGHQQQFQFGLAYYNLARMLALQGARHAAAAAFNRQKRPAQLTNAPRPTDDNTARCGTVSSRQGGDRT
jgi:hypothetical protein